MPRRPNVLIFMTDQQQAASIEAGNPCATPHARRLAADGLRFGRCYTPAAHCCPARATFQTGLQSSGHGVYNNVTTETAIHADWHPGVSTFGEALAEAGYRLFWSGKWHATRSEGPAERGWAERGATALGRQWTHRDWTMWPARAAQGADTPPARESGLLYRPGWGSYRHYGVVDGAGPDGAFDPGDWRVVEAGLDALDEAMSGTAPWCVYIGIGKPHDPYLVTETYRSRYDAATLPMPASWLDDLSDRPAIYQRQRQFWQQMSLDEQREAAACYWACCDMADDLFGLVLDRLDAGGQADDTLVIFMSDHGDYNGAHGLWMKGVPAFDEAYRVPCVMRWPNGLRQPGREVDEFVSLADFAPTFADLAGVAMPHVHGRSLAPFLRGEAPGDWRQEIVTQFNGVEQYYSQRAVITRDWKFVHNGFDWDELYDLRADHHELRNLAPRGPAVGGDHEAVIRDLCARLWRHSQTTGDHNANPYSTVALCPFGPMVAWEP